MRAPRLRIPVSRRNARARKDGQGSVADLSRLLVGEPMLAADDNLRRLLLLTTSTRVPRLSVMQPFHFTA